MLFCTDLTNWDFNCSDFFPMNGSTHTNSFLRCKGIYLFVYENIAIKSFDINVNKVTRKIISFKNVLKIKYLLMKKIKIGTYLKVLNNNVNIKFDLKVTRTQLLKFVKTPQNVALRKIFLENLLILLLRNDKELFSSISDINLVLGYWQSR